MLAALAGVADDLVGDGDEQGVFVSLIAGGRLSGGPGAFGGWRMVIVVPSASMRATGGRRWRAYSLAKSSRRHGALVSDRQVRTRRA